MSHRIRRTSKRIRRVRLKFEVFDGFLMIVKLWHTYVRPTNTWIRADYSMVVTRLKTTRCRHEATLAPRMCGVGVGSVLGGSTLSSARIVPQTHGWLRMGLCATARVFGLLPRSCEAWRLSLHFRLTCGRDIVSKTFYIMYLMTSL